MIPTSKIQKMKSQHVIGVAVFICSLLGALAAEAVPVSVYGVGRKSTAGLPSELYRFNESGPMEQHWDIPESRHGLSLATFGTSLYVAEFGGAINRYDFNGAFLGQFADVSGLAGFSPNSPSLETDAAGNVYTSFSGQSSHPRTSFRLDQNGDISETFSHADLVFPRGIDATSRGDVYILSSGGGPDRLFKFKSDGTYDNTFFLSETDNPSDIAINEATGELFMADEFGQAIHVYNVSFGSPIFVESLPTPDRTIGVFVEPTTGRIFGNYYSIEQDEAGSFVKFTGFEISRTGSLLHTYVEDAPPRDQTVISLVAVVVPEPASILLVSAMAGCRLLRREPKRVL